MDIEKAKEILKPFEMYKVFPLAWLDKGENGDWSAMATAEAKGYLEGVAATLELKEVKDLVEAIENLEKWTYGGLTLGSSELDRKRGKDALYAVIKLKDSYFKEDLSV